MNIHKSDLLLLITHKIKQHFRLLLAILLSSPLYAQIQQGRFEYNTSYSDFSSGQLTVGTGKMVRIWKWTGKGFVTVGLKNSATGKEWCNHPAIHTSDWTLPGLLQMPEGKLLSVVSSQSTDDGFTTPHLEVAAEVLYPDLNTTVKYCIWAYPNASGIRTQLAVKTSVPFKKETKAQGSGLPATEMKVLQVSSVNPAVSKPEALLDRDTKTFWATAVATAKPVKPNYVVLDLKKQQNITGIALTQKDDYNKLGWVENFVLYASDDTLNWGKPVGNGYAYRVDYPQYFKIPARARYIKLVASATTKMNTGQWQTSISEIHVYTTEFPYESVDEGRAEYLPVDCSRYSRKAIGYIVDQQFRNAVEYPFLREEMKALPLDEREVYDWNNILSLQQGGEGAIFVKESHKTASQKGHLTGEFVCGKTGLEVTGWGMSKDEISAGYQKCWANWIIMYTGDEDDEKLALKKFDRLRYPATLPGHKQIYANSWGYGDQPEATWRQKMDGALEPNVLKAMKISAEMGIENYLIDVGWSETPDAPTQVYPFGRRPHPQYYPNGWETVKKARKTYGVNLSLWTDIKISTEELNRNQHDAGFVAWKWDFAVFNDFASRNDIEQKARNFIRTHQHKVALNWDATENMPRYGFFWGREYGMIFLTNREQNAHILYTPSVALRDAWDLAKYMNTNKFQITVRNVKNIMPGSDADLHGQDYSVAIACAGIPMFFEKLESYSEEDKKVIRNFLDAYKAERDAMYDSYVFAVGQQPDNASFGGFQFVNTGRQSGHLLLFRELHCTRAEQEIRLSFLKSKTLKITDIRNGASHKIIQTDPDGIARFKIEKPADFLFYKYEVIN